MFFICSSPCMSSVAEHPAPCRSTLVCFCIMLLNDGRGSPKPFAVWIRDRLISSYLWIIWVSKSLWASVWYCSASLCASSYVVIAWGSVFWTVIKPLDWLVGNFPSPVSSEFCAYFPADLPTCKYTYMFWWTLVFVQTSSHFSDNRTSNRRNAISLPSQQIHGATI